MTTQQAAAISLIQSLIVKCREAQVRMGRDDTEISLVILGGSWGRRTHARLFPKLPSSPLGIIVADAPGVRAGVVALFRADTVLGYLTPLLTDRQEEATS